MGRHDPVAPTPPPPPPEPPLDFTKLLSLKRSPLTVEYSLKLAALKLVLAVFDNRYNDIRSNGESLQ